jgi:hypothetical protein
VAYITDGLSIRRILDHLGLSPPEEKPPPELAEVVRVGDRNHRLRALPPKQVSLPVAF